MACLTAGALALSLTACASSAARGDASGAAAPEAVTQDLLASDLARELALVSHPGEDTFVLAPTGRADGPARIVLHVGTRIATVMGERVDLTRDLDPADGDLRIAAPDMETLRARWELEVAVGRVPFDDPAADSRRAPIPEGPPPVARPAPTVLGPRIGFADNPPTASELGAWTVPLRRRWDYIVVHHSASTTGSASAIHKWHLDRGMDGLGYDFVIGNGTGSRDGEVEVGYRWRQQLVGAHARISADTNFMNEHGIGICLVGDFTNAHPSPAQMRALDRLCTFLAQYCGIPPSKLRLHGELKSTACPGRNFPRDFSIRVPAGQRTASRASTR